MKELSDHVPPVFLWKLENIICLLNTVEAAERRSPKPRGRNERLSPREQYSTGQLTPRLC